MKTKRTCLNCKWCHMVHEFVDENGIPTWADTFPGAHDVNGKDVGPNSYRCTKFFKDGDKIPEENLHQECPEFEEIELVTKIDEKQKQSDQT